MGNGTKFKLSNVLPNVFNRIKGIGSAPKKISGRPRGSSSSSTLSEWGMNDRLDQNDFCVVSRHSHSQVERSPSPVRIFPQNRSRDSRHSLSPSLGQKAYDIRFPAESPIRSTRGSKSRSDSPPPHGPTRLQNSVQSDPGCCSFDSTSTFVPAQAEGRVVVRKEFPSFGRSFMSKCNSFNGSTHSDSDISESDTSRARSSRRFRHSRTVSVHLDGNSGSAPSCCEGSGYGILTKAASSHAVSGTPLETACARGRSTSSGRSGLRARRKSSDPHNIPATPTATTGHMEHCQQLYRGSSPIHSDRRVYDDGCTPPSSYYKADYSKADYGTEVRHGKSGGSTGAASCPDSRRELERIGADFRQESTTSGAGSGRMGRFGRKLSFATAGGDNSITNVTAAVAGRSSNFDDTSFSSDEETLSGRSDGNAKVSMSKERLRSGPTPVMASQSRPHSQRSTSSRAEDAENLGCAFREVMLAQEKDHGSRDDNALFQQERVLTNAVLESSDGWARVQLSRLSNDEKPMSTTRVSQDGRDVKGMGARGRSTGAGNDKGEFQTAAAVVAVQNWSGGSFRASGASGGRANSNDPGLDRESLARLRGAGALDHILVKKDEEGEKIKVQLSHGTFRSPPNSKEASSRRSSVSAASPIGEVEKHTEGKINYKSCSPLGSSNRAVQQQKGNMAGFIFADEEFTRPGTDFGSKIYNYNDRCENSAKEFGSTWDTELNFPSFRSDSMLVGVGKLGTGQVMLEERATMIDFPEFSESKVPTPRTPGQFERKKQNKIGGHAGRVHDHGQNDRGGHGRTSNRSPSPGPREEVIRAGLKPFRVATTQSKSPARRPLQDLGGTRPRLSGGAQATPEFYGNGKKLSTRSPSPAKDFGSKRFSNRTGSPAPTHDHHGHTAPDFSTRPVRKTGRTPSPARDRSPTPKPASAAKKLSAKAEAGMQRLDSVAVVKASYDPYQDFRTSMVEMILENDIRTSEDLEDLLQCYLSLNSSDYHKVIVQVFTDIWGDIFEK